MKFSQKLTGGFLLVSLTTAMVGGVGYFSLSKIDDAYHQAADEHFPEHEAVEAIRYQAMRMVIVAHELALGLQEHEEHSDFLNLESDGRHDDLARESDHSALDGRHHGEEASSDAHPAPGPGGVVDGATFESGYAASILDQFHRYERLLAGHSPEERAKAVELKAALDQIVAVIKRIVAATERGQTHAEIVAILEAVEQSEGALLTVIEEIMVHEHDEFDELRESVATAFERGVNMLLAVGLAGFTVALALGSWLGNALSRPVAALQAGVARLTKGDLTARIEVPGSDELGTLARDVNQMAAALDQSTLSRDYVENVLRSMADALIVVDARGVITRANRVTSTLLGYGEEELVGQTLACVLEDAAQADALRSEASEHDISRKPATYRSRSGACVAVEISANTLLDADGAALGLVLVAQDVRQRRRAEQALERKNAQLEATNKELDQFAYVVSHDLKAPLRAIANLATWIEEDIAESITDDTRAQMKLLHGRVQRMEALINGVLAYSRVGRVAMEPEAVDTQQLVADIIDSMPVPEGFTVDVVTNMPTLQAASVPLGQVFANLISNAIKYRDRDDGKVAVSVEESGDFYRFTVADDGPGISPKYHKKIFEIFQTLAARDKVESTGVDLSLVKKIIHEQGGAISIESDEGRGAAFHFTWPRRLTERETA